MMETIAEKRCIVCLIPNTSLHLGIEACRGCASFFKRLTVSGRRYPCRKGTGKCEATKEEKLACRRCRYDKCLEVGMVYEGCMRNMKKNSVEKLEDHSPPPIINPQSDSLLDRIGREFEVCTKRRLTKEQLIVREHKLTRIPHPTEELYLASFDSSLECFKISFDEYWKFFFTVFPALNEESYELQMKLMRLCVLPFNLVEQFWSTKKIFGGFKRYSMFSLLLCADKERPEVWAGRAAEQDVLHKDELIESIRRYDLDLWKLLLPSFEKADLREKEAHALLALFVCESELRDMEISENCHSFIEKVRKEIHEDLHRFYTEEMGLTEYSTRLGNLVTVGNTFLEAHELMQSTFRAQTTIFDNLEGYDDALLKDLML